MHSSDVATEVIDRRYQLRERIGTGGMGAVYTAVDRLTGETVALKRIATHRDGMNGETLRLALTREFRTLASLRHPNIISVLDYGFDDDRQPYFTMQLVDNARSLRDVSATLPPLRKIELVIELLQALVYLHRRDIIHRDLKPDNVVVTPEGHVKVLDFGLALANELPESTVYAGTIRYMAPEVLQGAPPTAASDLYSVGVIAYELLTGHPAFHGETPQELTANVLTLEPDMTGIDILTAGELRQAAHWQPNDDPTLPMPPGDGTSQSENDQTILIADSNLQDTLPTQVIESDQRQLSPAKSGRTYAAASPFVRVISRLMSKRPERRYRNARVVIEDLRAALGQSRAPDNADIRDSFLQAARFVGRDAELSQLSQALKTARDAQGAVWLVGGESGAGKSRLLNELGTLAMVQGVAVLRGQASDEGLPYPIWREPLRRMVLATEPSDADAAVLKQVIPDIDRLLQRPIPQPAELEAGEAQERLHATARRLVEAYCRMHPDGVLLILEDIHRAANNLQWLRLLQPVAARLPLLVVCSYRNDETPDLPAQLAPCETLTVERLNADSIAELSESMLGPVGRSPHVVAMLQRETEGNVYFLIEVARVLAEEAPLLDSARLLKLPERVLVGGIGAVLQRRLDQVAPKFQPLLVLAAIHGREVDIAVLSRLAGAVSADDWLTACANAAVMEWQDGRWHFAHDKLRDQLLATLPPEARPPLYRKVAQAVEATYSQSLDQQAALLAHLWSKAGDAAAELRYSITAGSTAAEASAYAEAAAHFSRALQLLPHVGDESAHQEIRLRLRLGNAEQALGQYTQAAESLTTAYRLATAGDHPHQAAEALLGLGRVRIRQGDLRGALDYAVKGLDLVERTDDTWLRVEAMHFNAVVDIAEGRYEQGEALLRACLPLVRRSHNLTQEVTVLSALGSARSAQGHHQEALETLHTALDRVQHLRNRALHATIHANLGRAHYRHAEFTAAKQNFDKALPLFQAVGSVFGEAAVLFYQGNIATEDGQFAQALELLRQSVHVSRRIGAAGVTLLALCGLARLAAVLGYEMQAAELLGLILNHAATTGEIDVEREAVPLLNRLAETIPPDALDAALDRGKLRALNSIVMDLDTLDAIIHG